MTLSEISVERKKIELTEKLSARCDDSSGTHYTSALFVEYLEFLSKRS